MPKQIKLAQYKFPVMVKILIGGLLPFALLLSCQNQDSSSTQLTIAAAANMQFVAEELTEAFTKSTGIECHAVISSSGKLTAQIKEGAPFDLFVSADMKYPEDLFDSGLTTSKPKVYAYGRLVLYTMSNQMDPSIDLLTHEKITHIAIANPKTAPYGTAALQVLEHYDMLTEVEDKLVYGESIAQTNQFINSKAAEIGFTAKSVVLSPEMKGVGQWIDLDTAIYTPLAQGVVILKNRDHHLDQAQMFYDFLFSDKGKEILDKFGYSVI